MSTAIAHSPALSPSFVRPWPPPPPGPRLRSLLVGAAERARHRHAEARELAPGLHELVAVRRCDGSIELPARGELRFHGLDADAAFTRARGGTCEDPLELGRAGPLPGVHAYILGGPGGLDTAVVALELADGFATTIGAAGIVLAVPARGTALFIAPRARGLARVLTQVGRFRQFWSSDGDDAPLKVRESLRFLATWTSNAHARLPGPVSPALYWQRPHAPLVVLTDDARIPFDIPDALVDPAP